MTFQTVSDNTGLTLFFQWEGTNADYIFPIKYMDRVFLFLSKLEDIDAALLYIGILTAVSCSAMSSKHTLERMVILVCTITGYTSGFH